MSQVAAAVERWRSVTLTDEQIVERVRAGETALFEVLMRRYNQRLYRVVRGVLRDEAETEDVMQQAYVNAFQHLDQFASRSKFATWLTKIALYEAFARVRKSSRYEPVCPTVGEESEETIMLRLESAGPTPERLAFASELRSLLESSIDALPPGYRTVFVMREVEAMSTAETAECLEINEDAVKTRLHRARAMLQRDLYQRAGLAAPDALHFHLSRCDRVVDRVFGALARAHGSGT
jgi:RNA polymerase sigma-70 factor (ECF subfamily)